MSVKPMIVAAALLLVIPAHPSNAELENARRLSTGEISLAFSNMRDTAQVQDAAGTTAVNHWYKDGRFINHWTNDSASGTVTGHWYAEDGLRCVVIRTGIATLVGSKKCGPIYRTGEQYISLNRDGSIHGIHRLSPMKPTEPGEH